MYAIISLSGKQFLVKEGEQIEVLRLAGKAGDQIEIKDVLAVEKDGKLINKAESLKTCSVAAEIVAEKKGEKIYVFKKIKKTGYKRGIGHRDRITVIKINSIRID